MSKRVLMPLPDVDFDTTEVAVPWKLLREAGHEVVFATENGEKAACDPLLLSGVVFGQLGAEPEPKRFYEEMESSAEFSKPIAWRDIQPEEYDALHLSGGHAPGMRQYLGSELLQSKVAEYWKQDRIVTAICHGVLLLARSKDPTTGKSVVASRKTTCLPKYMERTAYLLTFWKLGRYYRTYDAYTEDEVRSFLDDQAQFERGPRTLTGKGTREDDRPAFVVEDGRYLSARWPGDAYLLGKRLAQLLA